MQPQYQAVIFDLDGTLTDNMPFHWQAYNLFMQRHGLRPIDAALQAQLDGKRNDQILPVLFQQSLSPELITQYGDEKEAMYRELAAGRLAPLRGLPELIALLTAKHIPIAVATSAPYLNVGFSLEQLKLTDVVQLVVRGEEVPRGKPAPDVFLETARRLGIDPLACLVFEDALAGIESARNAGMDCVAVTTTNSREQLAAHGFATLVVDDFAEYLERYGAWLEIADAR